MPNDRLKEILPFLRPRSAEPTLFTQAVFYLLVLGLAAIVGLYFLRRYRTRRQRERDFCQLALEMPLDQPDVAYLSRLSRRLKIRHPQRLLTSVRSFDRHVGAFAGVLAREDLQHPGLAQIARIRQALGFAELPVDEPLSSTRQLQRGQTLMVWPADGDTEGVSPWVIMDRDEGSIAVAPMLRGDDARLSVLGIGDPLSVRFWREGDTEYKFRTAVVDHDPTAGTFLLEHADRVERSQQRDFYRVDVSFDLDLYSLPGGVAAPDHGEQETAQVALSVLDSVEDDIADTAPGDPSPGQTGGSGVPFALDLSSSQRLQGRVLNLSAGGMALTAPAAGSLPYRRWVVDPAHTGQFSLAGVVCQVIGDAPEGRDDTLKLRFENLPPAIESEIVRQVYEHQLLEVGGIDAGARRRPIPDADPDMPLPPESAA